MTPLHYIARIHKDMDSCYGVSFPGLPDVFNAVYRIDQAINKAIEVLAFAAEDWFDPDGREFPAPPAIDEFYAGPTF